jgi:hypothetical protein
LSSQQLIEPLYKKGDSIYASRANLSQKYESFCPGKLTTPARGMKGGAACFSKLGDRKPKGWEKSPV